VIILGFTFWKGSHDSSAALVRDGRLVAAAEEERFTRRKHDGDVPVNAIAWCLAEARISMRDVDVIAYPDHPFRTGPHSQLAEMTWETLDELIRAGRARPRSRIHKAAIAAGTALRIPFDSGMNPMVAEGFRVLRERYGKLPKVRFYGHHEAHAAAAFLTSGFEEAAVVTLDGRGGPISGATWHATKQTLRRTDETPYTNSLGWFYRDCTRYAGLGDFGEGKLMGLAPYGDRNSQRERVARVIESGGSEWFRYKSPPDAATLGFPPRGDASVLDQPYPDFAAAVQSALEAGYETAVRATLVEEPSDNLCLGGGVAMNCSANGRLLQSRLAKRIWVFPASGDAGLAVGASLLAARDAGELTRRREDSPYWGPSWTDDECLAAIRAQPGVSSDYRDDVAAHAAQRIASGEIVGWFQGRMELGPRALGNRSILADPRTVAMRDKVNRVKGREQWRPLAPSVLAERAADWFVDVPPNAFMLFAVQCTTLAREKAPGIVHVDGSARPQPVTRELNDRYHDLIAAFERITGVPIVINTSFNAAGEPIVCSPHDALRTFMATDLDALVLGRHVVTKVGAGAAS
jgi:carbamoyltransferase